MTNRNKNLQFACTLAIGVVFLLFPSRAVATNDENHIQEIMAGVNGNSKIQFIVIKQEGVAIYGARRLARLNRG